MNIFNLISGYTKYKVETDNREKLINELKNRCSVRDIRVNESMVCFSVFFRETKCADEILSKNQIDNIHKKSYGLTHLLSKYKKRAGLLIGALLITALVLLSSLFVWEISVEGNENVSDKEIIELLKNVGFHEGVLKRGIDTESVVNKCLIIDDRISWMSINFEGTVAHVELRESRMVNRIEKKENINLVASFNGIISRVDALSGMAAVTKGDVVTKGQILINAFIEKRTGGNSLRGANGFVWAETERSYLTAVPLYCYKHEYTENEKNDYNLSFLGKNLSLKHGNSGFDMFDYEIVREKLHLNSKVVLPIYVEKTTYRECIDYKNRRTEKQALDLAKKKSRELLDNCTSNFTQISVEDSFYVEEDVLYYFCTFYGIENIARELEFEILN